MSDSSNPDPPPILNYATPTTGKTVVIANFPEEAMAHMAASRLEAEGIEAMINDRLPIYLAGQRAARLAVSVDDVDAAVEVLKQTPAKKFLVDLPRQT
jgi:hypothetical protein